MDGLLLLGAYDDSGSDGSDASDVSDNEEAQRSKGPAVVKIQTAKEEEQVCQALVQWLSRTQPQWAHYCLHCLTIAFGSPCTHKVTKFLHPVFFPPPMSRSLPSPSCRTRSRHCLSRSKAHRL